MDLQQMTFMNEPACEPSPVYRGGSRASRIALSENGLRKTMNGTCGLNLSGLSGNCGRSTLLAKTLMAYYQQYMSPYAPTWKRKATKSGRSVYRLTLSVHTMKDTGFVSLASPRASQDFKPIRKQTPQEHNGKHGQALCASLGIIFPERIGQYINPLFAEWMMGFPLGWGDIRDTRNGCSATETPSCPSSFTPSSAP
jgi:hypothetical protein